LPCLPQAGAGKLYGRLFAFVAAGLQANPRVLPLDSPHSVSRHSEGVFCPRNLSFSFTSFPSFISLASSPSFNPISAILFH
jgi:hypothetical protein